ncbi:MAG: hypothetical protein PHD32_06725 [Eubacteriales bacterium]|nr:hypothetical protein [Eubacteriales bacterium]
MLQEDIAVLRPLAYRYYQASQHPRNAENARLYRAVNGLRAVRPVVLLDEIPFHELNYDNLLTLRCQDADLRQVEDHLRKTLFQWDHFPGDMIVPPYIPVYKVMTSTDIGVSVREQTLQTDGRNNIVSHEYIDQLSTEEDLEKLHEPVITYDREATLARADKIADALGDILPVRLMGHNNSVVTWDDISRYRGVEALLYDLVDRPEFTHRMVRRLTDIRLSIISQMEEQGLFEREPLLIHCTPALCDDLPGSSYDGGTVRRENIWGRGAAQIFSSVGKAMHDEFDIEYMREIFQNFGLVYYGCCEPLDRKMDIVERIPHLRKVSITPWANVDVAAEAIGGRYVLSSKPNPASVAVAHLDEQTLRAELGRIFAAVKRNGCSCDMVLKDISSAGYNLKNLMRWEQIAMEMAKGL